MEYMLVIALIFPFARSTSRASLSVKAQYDLPSFQGLLLHCLVRLDFSATTRSTCDSVHRGAFVIYDIANNRL